MQFGFFRTKSSRRHFSRFAGSQRVLYNKLCTVNLEMNSVWACSSFCSEYLVPFLVSVSVVVYKVMVLLSSLAVYVERLWIK